MNDKNKKLLKQFVIALVLFLLGYLTTTVLFAQTIEKPKVSIAVGGKDLFYYPAADDRRAIGILQG